MLARIIVAGLILSGLGCVEKLSLDERACPCVDGWRCCGTTCVPVDRNCPGCSLLCAPGEQCYSGDCYPCNNSKACGPDCINCHDQDTGWVCENGRCGCRSSSDCPTHLDSACREGICSVVQQDGGTCEGNCDGGTVDGGTTDGGVSDGGPSDGDDGGVNPLCTNNMRCGPDCEDCTALESNWACLGDRCGCFDPADCLPDQDCQNNSCIP